MTLFEFIILTIYYIFAYGYIVSEFLNDDEYNTWVDRLVVIIFALIISSIYFPAIFANDIWKKLNKKK